jgi:hypothetical protein
VQASAGYLIKVDELTQSIGCERGRQALSGLFAKFHNFHCELRKRGQMALEKLTFPLTIGFSAPILFIH